MHVTLVHVQVNPQHIDDFIAATHDNRLAAVSEQAITGSLSCKRPTIRAASCCTKPTTPLNMPPRIKAPITICAGASASWGRSPAPGFQSSDANL